MILVISDKKATIDNGFRYREQPTVPSDLSELVINGAVMIRR
jgi:hypothetical protein